MYKKVCTLLVLLPLLTGSLFAQKIGLKVGMNVGGSRLYHDTDYKSTVVNDLYEYAAELFKKENIDYTWEQFARSNQLNTSFLQPRFGFSAHVSYANWPVFLIVDAMSSPSSYQKMAYGATLGMGRDFPIGDNIGMFITALGGYKYVFDKGFGANTLVNGIGDKSLRKNAQTFFAPKEPLGTNKGNLFTVRLGVGKNLGENEKMCVGVEGYGELDLTDRIQRNSRMTNIGAHIYMRYNLCGQRGEEYMPNPQAAGRN